MTATQPFSAELAGFFAAREAHRVETRILQPAEPYLDTAGEALRRRIFLTRGETGRSLCLRPDFTIPVALEHIAGGASLPRRYAYDGLVFRQGRAGEDEFRQAGIEDLGDADRAGADARSLADGLAALEACGLRAARLESVVGDQALFEAYLKALGLPATWQRRLTRTFGDDAALGSALAALAEGRGAQTLASVPHALRELARAGDGPALAAEVERLMDEGGLPPHRGRAPEEVAARLIEKVRGAEAQLADGVLSRLRAFLSIDCPLAEAEDRLIAVAAEDGADLGPALSFFAARNARLAALGLDLSAIRYRAAFGRPLDYYTGFVFEVSAPGVEGPLVGGGRYDRLVSYLGAREAIPAVGFALWMGRIEAAGKAGR